MDQQRQTIQHSDCRLAYCATGAGAPVLMIQGVGVAHTGWRPQVDALAREFNCITFDNRGIGGSQPAETKHLTVTQMAQDARAVLDAEQIAAAHIVGHSLGGLIALQLALDQPERVRSLSLICTFPGGTLAAPLTPRLLWLGMRTRVGTRLMRRRSFLRLVMPRRLQYDAAEWAQRMSELFGHDIADQPPIATAQLRALRRANCEPRLGELSSMPTLIVTGADDPIAPPRAGRAMHAGLSGSNYVEMPDASHSLPLTHTDALNEMLREHFRAADVSRGA